jgi:hypothetical protein
VVSAGAIDDFGGSWMELDEAIALIVSGIDEEPWVVQRGLKSIVADLRERPFLSEEGYRRRIDWALMNAERMRVMGREFVGLQEELQAAGFFVDGLQELQRPGVGGKTVLPILFKWLPLLQHKDLKQELVGVLGEKWAAPESIGPLLEEFRRNNSANDPGDNNTRWFIANSLCRVVDHRWRNDILDLIRDPCNESARFMLVKSLSRMRKSSAELIPDLIEFVESDAGDLYIPAARLLGRWKVAEALPRVQYLLATPEARPGPPAPGAWASDFEKAELKKALKALGG